MFSKKGEPVSVDILVGMIGIFLFLIVIGWMVQVFEPNLWRGAVLWAMLTFRPHMSWVIMRRITLFIQNPVARGRHHLAQRRLARKVKQVLLTQVKARDLVNLIIDSPGPIELYTREWWVERLGKTVPVGSPPLMDGDPFWVDYVPEQIEVARIYWEGECVRLGKMISDYDKMVQHWVLGRVASLLEDLETVRAAACVDADVERARTAMLNLSLEAQAKLVEVLNHLLASPYPSSEKELLHKLSFCIRDVESYTCSTRWARAHLLAILHPHR